MPATQNPTEGIWSVLWDLICILGFCLFSYFVCIQDASPHPVPPQDFALYATTYVAYILDLRQALVFALYLLMFYFVFCLILHANEYVTYILGMYNT